MANDPLLELLAKQSTARLRELDAELAEALQRTKFERELVLRALRAKGAAADIEGVDSENGKVATAEVKAPRRKRISQRAGDKRAAILGVMQTAPARVWMPTEIARAIAGEDGDANRDSVRVMMRRMLDQELERPADGRGFRLRANRQTSTNGSAPMVEEQQESQSEGQGARYGIEQQAFAHTSG